jgi:hypothetical protein
MKRRLPLPLSIARRGVAVFCALTVWLLGVFATSAQLHGALHDDAEQATHTCAITLFSHGLEDSLGGAELVITPALFCAGETRAIAIVPTADAHVRLPPGRGPPHC